jgi:hypothetical protein
VFMDVEACPIVICIISLAFGTKTKVEQLNGRSGRIGPKTNL